MKMIKVLLFLVCFFVVGYSVEILNYYVGKINDLVIDEDCIWLAREVDVAKMDFQGNIIEVYTIDDGISSNGARCIEIDKNGNVWFCTGGVSKFDGTNWTNYTSDSGIVGTWTTDIVFDNTGKLWVAVYNSGIATFDGQKWDVINVTNGLASNRVQCLSFIEKSGNIWAGTWSDGVCVFDGIEWTTYVYNYDSVWVGEYVNTITVDSSGNIWLGFDGISSFANASVFYGKNWKPYVLGSPYNLPDVQTIAVDKRGIKWIGCSHEGVFMLYSGKWENFVKMDGLIDNYVWSIDIDDSNNVWVGTDEGVSKILSSSIGIKYHPNMSNNNKLKVLIKSNPINEIIFLSFTLSEAQSVTIELYTTQGKLVSQIYKVYNYGGEHIVQCSTRKLSSGVYFFRIKTDKYSYVVDKFQLSR